LGNGSALLSFNIITEFIVLHPNRLTTFATGGYSRLFGTGNALNFGGGINFYIKDRMRALRFEVLDYWHISGAKEHNVVLRMGRLIL
jgi:hypothetical protein